MACCKKPSNTCRLAAMLCLTVSFFFVEIIVGYTSGSLALIGDSYHMLSDVVALVVGMVSLKLSLLPSNNKHTYGWARAEILGAFVNSVFLVALCFSLTAEAVKRLLGEPEVIENPDILLITGILGLLVNLIGLVLFAGIGPGGHGHSHGAGGAATVSDNNNNNNNGRIETKQQQQYPPSSPSKKVNNNNELVVSPNTDTDTSCETKDNQIMLKQINVNNEDAVVVDIENKQLEEGSVMNMRGVFLHVLGDALGSVVVIASAVSMKHTEGHWKYKIDPAMSLISVIIITVTTIPLLISTSRVLMQTVPCHIKIADIKLRLLKQPGVKSIHELHVWQLSGNRIIATCHVRFADLQSYTDNATNLKKFFHSEGIHSTTIQPEFCSLTELPDGEECEFTCPGSVCSAHTCCGDQRKKS